MIELMPNNILVRLLDNTPKDGLLVQPESYKEKSTIGEIVTTGTCILKKFEDKYIEIPFSIKPGDQVFLTKYAGFEIIVDDEHLWLITEDDILGVVECN